MSSIGSLFFLGDGRVQARLNSNLSGREHFAWNMGVGLVRNLLGRLKKIETGK